ncbi:Uncharacterized protein OBRU01_10879 [Operophtera brumata]|uniref:Uncharacterized protein n=1 Tax=Operophtera brumata TaxID=104452 RepID=A0A0L7LE87_OPEBR|nr:Uncharacterized protein OBRU01_10879 [Operophtera brumata]
MSIRMSKIMVLDYTQYYLDLATANRNVGAVEWSAEYNLTQYYSLHEVYLRAYSVKHDNTDSCDGACAHQHFCAITCVEHVAYRQCVEAAASALAAAGKASPLIAPLMTIATLFLFVLNDAEYVTSLNLRSFGPQFAAPVAESNTI